jgi:hypothetical protein
MIKRLPFLILILITLMAGCVKLSNPEPTPTIAIPPTSTKPIPTETLVPPEPTPTEAPTPQPTPTTISYKPIELVILTDTLNLREGPSVLFKRIRQYVKDDIMYAYGKSDGGEWVLVRTQDYLTGWVAVAFITLNGKVSNLPTFEALEAVEITGKVVGPDDEPIPGVVFAVHKGTDETRTDVTTDENGVYHAFLPEDSTGTWRIEIVGIDCNSPIVDSTCNHEGEFTSTYGDITLPQTAPLVFTYVP